MQRPLSVSLPAFIRSRAVPQEPQQYLGQLFTARGGSTAGSNGTGCEGEGSSPDTSLGLVCYRDTGIQELSGALGDISQDVQSRDSVRGAQM